MYARDGWSIRDGFKKRRAPEPGHWYWDRPILAQGEAWILRAFNRLSTCRSQGMGPGPIPWRDVVDFADRAGMIPAQFDAFDLAIAALDHAYLEWVVAERERRARIAEANRAKSTP